MDALGPDPLDRDVERSHEWLRALALRLGDADTRTACDALRAVLHLIRDRLPIAHGAALAAQLPLLIRGLYYEDWQPQAEVPRVRQLEEFLGLLERALRRRGQAALDPQRALDAVFDGLRAQLEPGELARLVGALPPGLQVLLADARRPLAPGMRAFGAPVPARDRDRRHSESA